MTVETTTIRGMLRDNRGFTLIEMAIVLIIIGIIIGAVVKGKDVVKSAEQKRLYTTFMREWQVAYNNYYDRTGWILGDVNNATNTPRNGRASYAVAANLDQQLSAVGLNAPAAGPTGLSTVRTYTDSEGRQYTLTLTFGWTASLGNFVRITDAGAGFPFDLGMAWDRIVDGSRDGANGDLLYVPDRNNPAPAVWPSVASGAPPNVSAAILRMEF